MIEPTKFSVLISVYKTEHPDYLFRALNSIWFKQILKPTEIVLVEDGTLPKNLYKVIEKFKNRLGEKLIVLSLKKNIGLGDALKIGLLSCKYNLVARMDTDDISQPKRFQEQINYFNNNPNIDILGSNIVEFNEDENIISSSRNVPLRHQDIIKTSKFRNPFNHPSVMYKKQMVLSVGGPVSCVDFDDYLLWVKMIQRGAICANSPSILLKMRAGPNQISKRGGLQYFINEYKFLTTLKDMEYLSFLEFYLSLLFRLPVRIMPSRVRKSIYKIIRRFS